MSLEAVIADNTSAIRAHEASLMAAAEAADAVIVDGDVLTVVDLKYGQGGMIDAKDNPQLQMYALAAMREFDYLANLANLANQTTKEETV